MMMFKKIVVTLVLCLGLAAAVPIVAQDMGTKDLVLDGGKQGKVPFPHQAHQTALKDCAKCHSLFPQESSAIKSLQAKGALKKKQVMNQCRNCHKGMKKAGLKTGPTSCKKCHIKS